MPWTEEALRELVATSTDIRLAGLAWEVLEQRRNPRDEHHTMDELYEQRMLWHAVASTLAHGLVTLYQGKGSVTKSWRHGDGEPCHGYTAAGERWFIVTWVLPDGKQVSQHYPEADWTLFQVPEVETAPAWDGHTPPEGNARLRAFLSP